MTDDKLQLQMLNNDLRTDLEQLELIMKDYAAFLARFAAQMDRHLYRAVASFMTDFYLCTESVFTAIAEQMDGGAPRGRNWHKRLLAGMAAEVPGVRPAVVTPELAAALTDYLVFRHVIPQAYGSSFEEQKLRALQERFQRTSQQFAGEIGVFRAFLEAGQKTHSHHQETIPL